LVYIRTHIGFGIEAHNFVWDKSKFVMEKNILKSYLYRLIIEIWFILWQY